MGRTTSDSDEDETFYYRYSSTATSTTSQPSSTANTSKRGGGSGSGGLAPSKSTVYVSNLDYNLTNSDLFTIFSTFGKVARVTVQKDKSTRRSKGVAFVLFVSRSDALNAATTMNGKILNGRTVKASIAEDNGRAAEFIRRRVYKDKSRCYECGEDGHLSYECPRNQLGKRERPLPKKGGRREKGQKWKNRGDGGDEDDDDIGERDWDNGEGFEDDNWASVVDNGADQRLIRREKEIRREKGKKKAKRASYFSDESDEDD